MRDIEQFNAALYSHPTMIDLDQWIAKFIQVKQKKRPLAKDLTMELKLVDSATAVKHMISQADSNCLWRLALGNLLDQLPTISRANSFTQRKVKALKAPVEIAENNSSGFGFEEINSNNFSPTVGSIVGTIVRGLEKFATVRKEKIAS
ncbi:hypothetical protein PoB_000670100 [Plakobranchus ocellatus]|uniref:Uncharacterized protein n=1 Tax=Plakobranchus ocellatus TaxID=259542 RepID=A0AAV3XZ31_9GAST|nr:hypothetical protein PoB_000670100 [Plakobranchus ocellatus]